MADAPKILGTDSLRQAYPKLNSAIDNSNEPLSKSNAANTAANNAISIANSADSKADSVQSQFDQVVIEGDSSVEAAQARVKEDGTSFDTLRERLNYSDANTPNKEEESTTESRWWTETIERYGVNANGEHLQVHTKPTNYREVVVFIGSSTTEGTGTTDRPNDNYMRLLENKLTGEGYSFHNRGIGGNNTQDAIDRFYFDVAPLNPDFVVFALTIGNEGIYNAATDAEKAAVYEQFKNNIIKLVRMTQQQGAIPIVTNQAPTQRYNSTVYRFARQLNSELEAMGIICVDWMGALNDLSGQPIPEGTYDTLHYNNAGHVELANAFPPSLFKKAGLHKGGYLQSPKGFINTGNTVTDIPIQYVPDYSVTTFTTFLRFRVSEIMLSGILSFDSGYRVALLANGNIGVYFTAFQTNLGVAELNKWYSLAVSFNYLSKEVRFYLDGEFKYSMTLSGFSLQLMTLAGRPSTGLPLKNADYKDVLIYRSRLTDTQIKQLHDGIYPQTSLELFSPMHDKYLGPSTSLTNIAPTTSKLTVNSSETALTPRI